MQWSAACITAITAEAYITSRNTEPRCNGTWLYMYQYTYCHYTNRKWQDYVYIQCEYKSTKQKIKHLLREENKVKENKIS